MICHTGKASFATEAEAHAEMARLRDIRKQDIRQAPTRSQRRKHNTKPVWQRAYQCPWCDAWHLTSKSAEEVAA